MSYFSSFIPNANLRKDKFMPHSLPVWLKGNTDEAVVICLHGFTATVYEAMPIARAVYQSGLDAACPLFPAHGLKDEKAAKEAMGRVKYEEWLDAIRNEIALARKHYKKVFIFGQSMGGAVALRMAEEQLVDACATTAPAIKLPQLYEVGISFLGKYNLNFHMEPFHPFFTEAYSFYNFKSTQELLNMAILVRNNLSDITCPVLACITPEDKAIDAKIVPDLLRENIPGVKIKWFLGDHCMTLDPEAEEVKKTITDFYRNLL